MTVKYVKLKDTDGDYLYPVTTAALVYLDDDGEETLEDVEAGAQVNVIESITLNGTEVTITDKTAAIEIDTSSIEIDTSSFADTSLSNLTDEGTAVITSLIDAAIADIDTSGISVDLSDYYTKEEIDALITAALEEVENGSY